MIQIDDSVIIHPLSMHFVNQYAREGYKIAANEFQFAPRYLTLLDSLDYIKLNSKTTTDAAMHNIIDIAHSMHKKCIVTNIETEEQYQKAVALGADAMEGTHVAEKLTTKAHSGAYLQSNFFRLMVAVTKDEPDVNEIEQMISMDASLSFAPAEDGKLCVFRSASPGDNDSPGYYDAGTRPAEAMDLSAQRRRHG